MKFRILQIGKLTFPYLKDGISSYHERIKHYAALEETTIPDLKNARNMTTDEIKSREGLQIIKNLKPSDTVILLDERGKILTSEELAEYLHKKMTMGKDIVFVIGGPFGFPEPVYARADERISLSRMTFPHQLVRLIFAEQLYRAMTIIRGEPYHHS